MQVAANNQQKNQASMPQVNTASVVVSAPQKVATKDSANNKKEKSSFFSFKKKNDQPINKIKSPNSKKQIPTILGLLILLFSLGAGVLLFGDGTGVFSPRATAETTPKNIRISNVTDKSFTISFYTDEETIAFIKYAQKGERMIDQASDDRDQLSGIVKPYRLHHITVRGLEANTDYEYVLGTGSDVFDNDGVNYEIKTASNPGTSPSNNQTVYGVVNLISGQAAEGAVVYIYNQGMGTLSTLVKSSGSWGLSLSNAYTTDKTAYAQLSETSELQLKIQGIEPTLISNWQTTVADAQPVQDLILGGTNETVEPVAETMSEPSSSVNKEELLASDSGQIADQLPASASSQTTNQNPATNLSDMTAENEKEREVVSFPGIMVGQEETEQTVTSSQPLIKTTLPANTTVQVEIHSDTQIAQTMTTDSNGELVVDIASLGENLEPGEHTASYTYVDPVTGQEVTKTYTFYVEADENLLALAEPTTIPYGSGNPYVPTTTPTPTVNPTVTLSPSLTASPTAILSATPSVVASTSAQYEAGSVGNTIMLLIFGFFFVGAGAWSYFLAHSFED
jgi:hypothetical protein